MPWCSMPGVAAAANTPGGHHMNYTGHTFIAYKWENSVYKVIKAVQESVARLFVMGAVTVLFMLRDNDKG